MYTYWFHYLAWLVKNKKKYPKSTTFIKTQALLSLLRDRASYYVSTDKKTNQIFRCHNQNTVYYHHHALTVIIGKISKKKPKNGLTPFNGVLLSPGLYLLFPYKKIGKIRLRFGFCCNTTKKKRKKL